jgi:protein-tyrosine-phosphatase
MSSRQSILFVCLHGSAKSLIAAEYFRRLTTERGHVVDVTSMGVEPDAEVPARVVAGLGADGFDVAATVPRPLTDDALNAADVVVSFGCDVDARRRSDATGRAVIRWDDVPAVSDGYETARDEIVRRVVLLVNDLC